MKKDFWRESTVAVIGGGSWGSVLAHLASKNCAEVQIWLRDEEQTRQINATRSNPLYVPDLNYRANVRAHCDMARVFERPVQAVIWALPAKACRERAKELAPYIRGDELIFHATKGVEEGSLKRVSVVLREELPCPRIGVISGPNLAKEIAKGEPAATVVASAFDEVLLAGQELLGNEHFRVYGATDVIGVEWAGTLKNILAIASGAVESLGLGWNTRSTLISRGLAEMVRFGVAMGGQVQTFLGLAGIGDLLATCGSPLSRNYRVGFRLAKGDRLETILKELGSTAEGARTAKLVWEFAREREIPMPITEGVCRLLQGEVDARTVLDQLMARPLNPVELY